MARAGNIEQLARRAPAPVKERFAAIATTNRVVYGLKTRYVGRRCDTFLVSYPKCGRTWLRVMLGRALQQQFAFPRKRIMQATNAAVARDGMPRVLATHDDSPQAKTPAQVLTDKSAYNNHRVVLLVRDPRDVIVSLYFHRAHKLHDYDGTLTEFVRQDVGGIDTIVRFYNAWDAQRSHLRDLLVVRYEDLHAAPEPELRRLLDFLGLPDVPDDVVAEAVQFAAFSRMKKMERKGTLRTRALQANQPDDPESFKVRNGRVGGYREYLDAADVAFLDEHLRVLAPAFGYTA
jgi:hypothetical protein